MKIQSYKTTLNLLMFVLVLSCLFIVAIPMKSQPDYQTLALTFSLNSISHLTPMNLLSSLEVNYLECSKDFIGTGSTIKFRSEATCFDENLALFFDRFLFLILSFVTAISLCLVISLSIEKISNNKILHSNWLIPMMFPAVSWALTFYSLECSFLIIAMFTVNLIHQFKFKPLWVLPLLPLFFFDRGNFFVIVLYLIYYLFFFQMLKTLKLKKTLLITLFFVIFIQFMLSDFLIYSLSLFYFAELAEPLNQMQERLNKVGGKDNPLISLIYTSISFIFYTPDRHWPYSLLIFFLIIVSTFFRNKDFLKKKLKKNFINNKELIMSYIIPTFLIPITFVSVLPNHAYAKYYLFLYAPIFGVLKIFIAPKKIIIILLSLSTIISLEFIIRFYSISI